MSILYRIFHVFYKLLGHICCKVCLLFWNIRDSIRPPKEKAILFVAHPDDDTLFFHTFIKEQKPYVVLMTTGWSLRRMPDFMKAMKNYGVRYRAYDMETRDERIELLKKRVSKMLQRGNFEMIAAHNSTGEYGHVMHQRVHEAVADVAGKAVLSPVSAECIRNFPLSDSEIKEKENIFNHIYTTEVFVLDQYRDWVTHEKLEPSMK